MIGEQTRQVLSLSPLPAGLLSVSHPHHTLLSNVHSFTNSPKPLGTYHVPSIVLGDGMCRKHIPFAFQKLIFL